MPIQKRKRGEPNSMYTYENRVSSAGGTTPRRPIPSVLPLPTCRAAWLCPYPLQNGVSGNTKKKLSRVSDSSVTVARDYANNTFITRYLLTTYGRNAPDK
jgi:hypothetical protein